MDNTLSGHESSAGRSPATAPPSAAQSARRRRSTSRREEYERETLERRHTAEQRADRIIRAARANRNASTALGDVALRAAEALGVEQCELLILRAADQALLIETRIAPPPLDGKAQRERSDPARSKATTELYSLRVPPTASPTTLLRGHGPANRVTVFIHHAKTFRPLGVLSIATALDRQLTIEDRVFANAIGDRLSVAIANGDFPWFR